MRLIFLRCDRLFCFVISVINYPLTEARETRAIYRNCLQKVSCILSVTFAMSYFIPYKICDRLSSLEIPALQRKVFLLRRVAIYELYEKVSVVFSNVSMNNVHTFL